MMLTTEQEEKIRQDQRAYRLCFGSPAGGAVLVDLADFCRANETCAHADLNGRIDHAKGDILTGRREVWLRIQNRLFLTPAQLGMLYVRTPVILQEEPTDG